LKALAKASCFLKAKLIQSQENLSGGVLKLFLLDENRKACFRKH